MKTKFEDFIAENGILRVTEHFKLTPPKTRFGICETYLIRSRNTTSLETYFGLKIQYIRHHENPQETQEIIDGDEIASLSHALQRVIENRAQIISCAKTYTEVVYTSRGGFQTGLYVEDTNVGEFMKIGHQSALLTSLSELHRLLGDALLKMETIDSPNVFRP